MEKQKKIAKEKRIAFRLKPNYKELVDYLHRVTDYSFNNSQLAGFCMFRYYDDINYRTKLNMKTKREIIRDYFKGNNTNPKKERSELKKRFRLFLETGLLKDDKWYPWNNGENTRKLRRVL